MARAAWLCFLLFPLAALAHNVSESNTQYLASLNGPAIIPFLYLGAKHMVTGYDHVLYLIGVVFFLREPRDIALYVTLFAVGHSITLLAGVLGSFGVNANLIDAIIGFSIVYKAFENLNGFEKVCGFRPNTQAAVFIFGLCHGLGLASKLQEIAISENGLLTNLVSFNVGVELGQGLALLVVLMFLVPLRHSVQFERQAFAANTLLMIAGFTLAGYQITGYLV